MWCGEVRCGVAWIYLNERMMDFLCKQAKNKQKIKCCWVVFGERVLVAIYYCTCFVCFCISFTVYSVVYIAYI